MAYSYIIKNATVIDGAGEKMRQADIGISGKEIKVAGEVRETEGGEVIDGAGLYCMPGMVDLTNHADRNFSLFGAPQAENLVRQGITTIVTGVCGISLAPLTSPEDINVVSPWIDIRGINTDWLSFGEFREALGRQRLGINVVTLAGYATIAPHGDQALFLFEQALAEGARGFSVSLHHAPGQSISEKSLFAFAERVHESQGLFSLHLRDEGADLFSSTAEAIRVARLSGARTHIAHLQALGRTNWPHFAEALTMIRHAREEGVMISADVTPYGRTNARLVSFLPAWALERGEERIKECLADAKQRKEIEQALNALTLHPDRILFASLDKEKELVGKTLAHVAELRGVAPEVALLDILYANDLRVRVFSKTIAEANVREAFKEEFVAVSSNGEIAILSEERPPYLLEKELPHPRSFGTLPRFFDRFVKNNAALSWEEAVRRATSLPAGIAGIADRGLIKTGMKADIVLFDPATIKDNATYLHPYQYPDGIKFVFVNGKPAVADGIFRPLSAGEVL